MILYLHTQREWLFKFVFCLLRCFWESFMLYMKWKSIFCVLLCNILQYEYITICLSIHLLDIWILPWCLATVNKAMKIFEYIVLWVCGTIPLDYVPRSIMGRHRVGLFLVLLEITKSYLKQLYHSALLSTIY